jgi:ESCRT-I complex subunit VPS28
MNCPAAINRFRIGVPATIEHATASDLETGKSAKYVAETVQVVCSGRLHIDFQFSYCTALYHADGLSQVEHGGRGSDSSAAQRSDASPEQSYYAACWFRRQDQDQDMVCGFEEGNDMHDMSMSRLVTLNKMKASDEINEEQVRQLMFDLETAHSTFYRSLSEK